jgi:uncharacterized sulfatase
MHGAWTLGTHLSPAVPTLGAHLTAHGYHTALVGKAHFQGLCSTPEYPSIECQPTVRDLEFWRRFSGPWYGFSSVETARNHGDEAHAGGHYAVWMEEQGLANWRDYFQDYPANPQRAARHGARELPAQFHYSTWTAERTIAQIEGCADRDTPFFLWSSFHDPHPPYLVPEPYASMYDPADMEIGTLQEGEFERMPPHFALTQTHRPDFSAYNETSLGIHGMHSHLVDEQSARENMALYYGMTTFMDEQIERVLASLEANGLADNTLVVFTTDHGHFLGQHGLWAKGPFHYEDEIKVPFIARWPQNIAPQTNSLALQSLVDLAPTFLAAAQVPIPGLMQGVNQLEVWRGAAESAREDVLVEFHHEPTKIHLRTFVNARYKLTLYRDQTYGELFDLEQDPEERSNLYGLPEFAAVQADLMRQWLQAEIRREPMPMPRLSGA